jgi:hypothetical protein
MRVFAIILVLAFSWGSNTAAQVVGTTGEMWNQIGVDDVGVLQKIVFLRGIYEGAWLSPPQLECARTSMAPLPEAEWETLTAALDQFYADARNVKVLVVYAIHSTARVWAGQDPQLDYYRCRSHAILSADAPDRLEQALASCRERWR